nr:hypothetical protein BaRGS_017499 [Batillaria attramentaria]
MKAVMLLSVAILAVLVRGATAGCCTDAICDCCASLPFGLGNIGCFKTSYSNGEYNVHVKFAGKTVMNVDLPVGPPDQECTSKSVAGVGYKACVKFNDFEWVNNKLSGCLKMKLTFKAFGIKKSKTVTLACI